MPRRKSRYFSETMEELFEEDAAALKEKLLLMAGRVENMVRRAMRGLLLHESGLAHGIKAADSEVDRFEKEIDEAAVGLLAKARRPVDLRLLVVAMKISNNLERVGDEATTIARRAQDLARPAPRSRAKGTGQGMAS